MKREDVKIEKTSKKRSPKSSPKECCDIPSPPAIRIVDVKNDAERCKRYADAYAQGLVILEAVLLEFHDIPIEEIRYNVQRSREIGLEALRGVMEPRNYFSLSRGISSIDPQAEIRAFIERLDSEIRIDSDRVDQLFKTASPNSNAGDTPDLIDATRCHFQNEGGLAALESVRTAIDLIRQTGRAP